MNVVSVSKIPTLYSPFLLRWCEPIQCLCDEMQCGEWCGHVTQHQANTDPLMLHQKEHLLLDHSGTMANWTAASKTTDKGGPLYVLRKVYSHWMLNWCIVVGPEPYQTVEEKKKKKVPHRKLLFTKNSQKNKKAISQPRALWLTNPASPNHWVLWMAKQKQNKTKKTE